MNIVFYSSYSNFFDASFFHYTSIPSWKSQLDDLCNCFPEYNFFIVCQKPGMFLLDLKNDDIEEKSNRVKYIILENAEPESFAKEIILLKADIAFAFTFWCQPYDWLTINDSLIAKRLEASGIKTFCHSTKTACICFDKKETRDFLLQNNFNCAKSVYVDHELFFCERSDKSIIFNPYKKYIFNQIRNLNLPLVIKNTRGLSSYGMEVVKTYAQAEAFLKSKKNQTNLLVEEYIEGEQAGIEIFGSNKKYSLGGLFYFSVNQYGITSPKQSVKIGPVSVDEKLEKMLLRLAENLNLCGSAQVDLVKKNNEWFIIEINPRLSGMTLLSVLSENKSVYKKIMEVIKGDVNYSAKKCLLDFKTPVLEKEKLLELKKEFYVEYILQTKNDCARQHREEGYCELIFSALNFEELKNALDDFKCKYPDLLDKGFEVQAKNLLQSLLNN